MFGKLAMLIGLLALASLVSATNSVVASLRPFSASLGSLLPRPGQAVQVSWKEMFDDYQHPSTDIVVLDLRSGADFIAGHVSGSFKVKYDYLHVALPWLHSYDHYRPTLYFVGPADELDKVAEAATQASNDDWFTAVYFVADDISGWPGKIETSQLTYPISDAELKPRYNVTRILDVRAPAEFREAHIPDSVCMPAPSFNDQALVWIKPLVIIGATTEDAQKACVRAADFGAVGCYYFEGGFAAWTGDKV
jgi:rhodanese-related sulfurtransferase